MSDLFTSLISWIVSFAFYVPFQILRLIGLLFPSCTALGFTQIANGTIQHAVNWIRFYWPIIQYVPWAFVWNILSAVFLYVFVRWLTLQFHNIASFVLRFWWIIAIFYTLGGAVDFFLSYNWMDSTVFSEVFGDTPTTTGFSGGGGGGGGGSSW